MLGLSPQKFRIAVAAAALVFCYAGVFVALANGWAISHVYSYGFAVPVISVYLVWTRAESLRALSPAPDYRFGVPLAVLTAILLLVGHLGALATVQGVSLVLALAAGVLLLFGRRMFGLLVFPILYLFLMVPIWNYPIERLQVPSQLLSAKIAVDLLQLIGVPALREGTTIALPADALEVLRECSGVNQLVVIIATALPAAYVFLEGFTRRAALIGMAVIVAYLSNGFRIAMVGFLAHKGLGSGDLRELHLLEGLIVSSAGYLLLGGCLVVLSQTQDSDGGQNAPASSAPSIDPNTTRASLSRGWLELAVVATFMVAGTYGLLFRPVEVRLASALNSLPAQIAEWTVDLSAEPHALRLPALDDQLLGAYPTASGERHFMGIDDELVRTYRTSTGERVRLYIGYHRYQQHGKELTGDASYALSRVTSRVGLDLDSGAIEINEVARQHAGAPRGIFYWYDLNGRVVTDTYVAKAYSVWDALTRRRTNGAVIMVGWECRASHDCDVSRHKGIAFVRALVPLLPQYLPS